MSSVQPSTYDIDHDINLIRQVIPLGSPGSCSIP